MKTIMANYFLGEYSPEADVKISIEGQRNGDKKMTVIFEGSKEDIDEMWECAIQELE